MLDAVVWRSVTARAAVAWATWRVYGPALAVLAGAAGLAWNAPAAAQHLWPFLLLGAVLAALLRALVGWAVGEPGAPRRAAAAWLLGLELLVVAPGLLTPAAWAAAWTQPLGVWIAASGVAAGHLLGLFALAVGGLGVMRAVWEPAEIARPGR